VSPEGKDRESEKATHKIIQRIPLRKIIVVDASGLQALGGEVQLTTGTQETRTPAQ